MTHAQTPYEQPDVLVYQEPERTSVMAILSLVFGIGGCCLGVTSILAVPLAVIGLVGISRSKGRVGGTGFAIAGLIIGILTLAIWIGIIFGAGGAASAAMGQLGGQVETTMSEIEGDRFDEARAALAPPASEVSDEEIIAFREAYRSSLGNFVSVPDGIGDWWSGYMAIGQQIQDYQGQPGNIPIPARFDSGWGLVIYRMDPGAQTQGVPPATELIVVDMQGNEFRLPSAPPGGAPGGPDMDTLPEPGELPGEPGDEEIGPGDEIPAGDPADDEEGP